jgi:two-component system chemotaxis sensor kinase CheA
MSDDPYRYFRIEARELTEELGKWAIELEVGKASEAVARLLRAAHTLKGAARIVRQREIAEAAHAIEERLAPFRDGAEVVPGTVKELLAHIDEIARRIVGLDPPAPSRSAPPQSIETVRVELRDADALSHGLAEMSARLEALERSAEGLDGLRREAAQLAAQLRPRELGAVATERARAIADGLHVRLGREAAVLSSGRAQLRAELRQVRDLADRLRLSPVASVFAALARAAHDAAQALGKRVAFRGEGDDVRLEANVLALVRSALLHLVRNAVAHGIERPDARAAAGKPPEGVVSLTVSRRGNKIVVSCSDDGAGVDLTAVRAAAERSGVFGAGRLDAHQAALLLLHGGLTTREEVDEISGRGVGLDVVRNVAEQLHGELDLHSEPGRGTTFELTVPIALASTRALVVEAGGAQLAFPLDAVQRVQRVTAADLSRSAQRETIEHEGEQVPYVSLRRLLGLDAGVAPAHGWTAVVLRGAAVGVDRLLGAIEVVARPLPPLARAHPMIGGAALDPEGRPRLMLDPVSVVAAALEAVPAQVPAARAKARILVVDDSLTTRMLEQAILESAGYDVELATSGEQALEKVRGHRYALVLVDVEMGGIDGFEVVSRLRADPATRALPAVLVTSRGSDEDRARAVAVGASAHVLKGDFDQGILLDIIRGLIR